MLTDLVERIGQCTHAELRDDPSIGRGGCVISTGRGRIDATIDRQLERISQALLGRSKPAVDPEAQDGGAAP